METTSTSIPVLDFRGAAAWRTLVALLLLASMSFQIVQESEATATVFKINNTALRLNTSGGIRFQNELHSDNILNVLQAAKEFICASLNLSGEIPIDLLTIYVDVEASFPAYTVGIDGESTVREVHLSEKYVESYARQNSSALQNEIRGVLFHECTHVWQNFNGSYGVDPQFTGLIEGIADYIRLTSGYSAASWIRQRGGNWSDGYSTTAYFLDWVDRTQVKGFVNQLNYKMATPWNVSFFQEITRNNIDQLWQAYQATL